MSLFWILKLPSNDVKEKVKSQGAKGLGKWSFLKTDFSCVEWVDADERTESLRARRSDANSIRSMGSCVHGDCDMMSNKNYLSQKENKQGVSWMFWKNERL